MIQQNEEMIVGALEYLKSIPQMKRILENLPDKIAYKFSQSTPGIASFNSEENAITLKPTLIDLYNPQERLSFYVTLAHELCHANQKKEGLYYNDLSEASFGDTFRVGKMMETEKRDTYVFEDMLFALNTAKTDGFPTVGVYDRHEAHQDDLKELADYYIFDFTDPILKTI